MFGFKNCVLRGAFFSVFMVLIAASCASGSKGEASMTTVVDTAVPDAVVPDALARPAAWTSGVHANGFVEHALANESEVKRRVQETYAQLFLGTDGMDINGKALLVRVGEDKAFINAPDSKDIRSEGMSYGMIIAVMMDDKSTFDKLWTFAKQYMQHAEGVRTGYFAWSLQNTPPFTAKDPNPAPDGEEYFVMSLFFAEKRWGRGEGIYDYGKEANAILSAMVNTDNDTVKPLINPKAKQIVFTPDARSFQYTDPSYHLPAFTKLWSLWAAENKELYAEMTTISRDFFAKSAHPVTGLHSEYTSFDGKPVKVSFNSNSHNAAHDSHRVVQNIAMDVLWFKEDAKLVELVERYLRFANEQYKAGGYGLVGVYTPEGQPLVTYSTESQVAMNAVAAMVTNKDYAKSFITRLWNQSTPQGQWRYYNGLLHMLGLLHVAGEFKIWGNPVLVSK